MLRLVKKLNRKTVAGYVPMDPAVQEALSVSYAPFNAQRAALTGLDLSAWRAQAGSSFSNQGAFSQEQAYADLQSKKTKKAL